MTDGWGEWSSFGSCSVTCDQGLQARNRTCLSSQTGSSNKCVGHSIEALECNLTPCSQGKTIDKPILFKCISKLHALNLDSFNDFFLVKSKGSRE